MKRMKLVTLLVSASLVLTGCSLATASTNEAAPQSSVHMMKVPHATKTPKAPHKKKHKKVKGDPAKGKITVARPDDGSGGADAAPAPQLGSTAYTGNYDASQTAIAGFYSWWNYEVQEYQDARLDFTNLVYPAGTSVCTVSSQGVTPATIVDSLTRNMGITRSGAMAITKAALNALCPRYNIYAYDTYFDQNAKMFRSAVEPKLTLTVPAPNEIDYGLFMKEACAYMQKYGGKSDIYNHMLAFGSTSSKYQLYISGISRLSGQSVTYLYIQQAILNGCGLYINTIPIAIGGYSG